MGNGYDPHSIHHHHAATFHQKSIFLPMFCRLSIKDIKLNNHCNNRISGDEPSSPKVSCMGQVKRNNRVIGYPTTATTVSAAATVNSHHKYTKLKKLFSSKTLLPPTTSIPAVAGAGASGGRSGSRSCRTSREMRPSNSRRLKLKKDGSNIPVGDQDCVKVVDIGEMDPPLPVVKKVSPPGEGRDEVNIWKRRFNGASGLKSLQIEQIQLGNSTGQPAPTTV